MTTPETKQTPLVIRDTLTDPGDIRHPTYEPIGPQVVAKHCVTKQQIANALQTLLLTDQDDFPIEQLRFSFQRSDFFHANGYDSNVCVECGTHIFRGRYTISKRTSVPKESEDPLVFTHLEWHNMIKHGRGIDTHRIVRYLSLKPNTSYVPVTRSVLYWRYEGSFFGPLDMTDLSKYDILSPEVAREMYRYDKNGTMAVMYKYYNKRILLLSSSQTGNFIVEGIVCYMGPALCADTVKFHLDMKHVLVPRDWFCI